MQCIEIGDMPVVSETKPGMGILIRLVAEPLLVIFGTVRIFWKQFKNFSQDPSLSIARPLCLMQFETSWSEWIFCGESGFCKTRIGS